MISNVNFGFEEQIITLPDLIITKNVILGFRYQLPSHGLYSNNQSSVFMNNNDGFCFYDNIATNEPSINFGTEMYANFFGSLN